jgi:hypothetical protein
LQSPDERASREVTIAALNGVDSDLRCHGFATSRHACTPADSSQIVLLLLDLLRKLNPGDHDACIEECFEAKHRLHAAFHAPMALLQLCY